MAASLIKAFKLIQESGGIIHTAEAIKKGINSKTLYALRDKGMLEQVSRGVFRLFDHDISSPDFVTIMSRAPHAVICLITALSFHELTTQIPHAIDIAIARNARAPRINWPPIRVYRRSPMVFEAGIEKHQIDGVTIQIYSAEKTLVDCFKYRNKLGIDIVLEALKFYRVRKPLKVDDVIKYAKICRVEKIMMPYLESIW